MKPKKTVKRAEYEKLMENLLDAIVEAKRSSTPAEFVKGCDALGSHIENLLLADCPDAGPTLRSEAATRLHMAGLLCCGAKFTMQAATSTATPQRTKTKKK